jgi:ubiquinone/menaquinone biosynthesis C-methylase UbiE
LSEKDAADIVEWYDTLADGYDELYAAEQSSKYDAALKAVASRRFGVAVDAGCGTGLFLDRLRVICDLVLGVDLSREMLAKAKVRCQDSNVSLVRADCSALPLKDCIAGCVFAISLLKPGAYMTRQLGEMSRVTQMEGIVVGTMFREGGEKPVLVEKGLESGAKWWNLSGREVLFLTRRAML